MARPSHVLRDLPTELRGLERRRHRRHPRIIEHLDYLLQLGCNAIWLNPLYESPFRDAGYDISDYKKVAARYGTNDDLAALFAAAHARGMHVLLDLVPGHTSNEHPWFRQSATDSPNLYDDRYIWTGN